MNKFFSFLSRLGRNPDAIKCIGCSYYIMPKRSFYDELFSPAKKGNPGLCVSCYSIVKSVFWQ